MAGEMRLMADGCVALLRLVYGESNWQRWNDIKQRVGKLNTQDFIWYLLDLAEGDILGSSKGTEAMVDSIRKETMKTITSPNVTLANENSLLEDEGDDIQDVTPNYIKEEQYEALPLYSDYYCTTAEASTSKVDESTGYYDTPSASMPHHPPTPMNTNAPSHKNNECVKIRRLSKDQFRCEGCHVSLIDTLVVDQHMSIRHPQSRLALHCFCCNVIFTSIDDFVGYHQLNAGKNKYVCSLCAKSFNSKGRLEDHTSSKHDQTGPKYECAVCQKRFSRRDSKNNHERRCKNAAAGVLYQ